MTALLDEYNAADKHDLHGLQSFMQITRPFTRFRTEMDEPDG